MKYKKKPVIIEAEQWDNSHEVYKRIYKWNSEKSSVSAFHPDEALRIVTLEGVMTASVDDYIIKGVNGELYPCKPDIFEKTYEKVEI